jgi:hypothetical protein
LLNYRTILCSEEQEEEEREEEQVNVTGRQ